MYWPNTKVVADFVRGDLRYPSGSENEKNPTVVFACAYPFGPVHSIAMFDCVAPFEVVGLVVSFAFVALADILVVAWAVV
jgi:hypothetical protein